MRNRKSLPLNLTLPQWLSIAALLIVQFLAAFYLQGMVILAPAFAAAYHLDALQVSTLISVKAFGSVLGGLALGASLDRINGRHLPWVGLLSALLLLGFAEKWIVGYFVLLVSMLILGMLLPVFSILGLYAITHDYPAHQVGKLLGIRQSVIPLGGIVAGTVFPLLFAVGLFPVLGGMGVLICGMTLLLLIAVRWTPSTLSVSISKEAASHVPLRILWPVGLVVFLLGAGQFSVLIFAIFYLHTLAIHAAWIGGVLFGVFLTGGFLARIVAGFLVVGIVSLKHVFAAILMIGALTMIIWGSFPDHPVVWGILCFSFILGIGIVGYNALPFQWAASLVDHHQKGRVMGIMSAVAGLSIVLWMPVFGMIVEIWGYRPMWYILAILYVVALVVVLRYAGMSTSSQVTAQPTVD